MFPACIIGLRFGGFGLAIGCRITCVFDMTGLGLVDGVGLRHGFYFHIMA